MAVSPCGDWSTRSQHTHRNQGADRSTQARRAVPLYSNPKASDFWYDADFEVFRSTSLRLEILQPE